MHIIYRFVLSAVFQIVTRYVEVVASSWIEHVALHEVFVAHARALLYNQRQQRIANIAVALCRSWCVAEVSAQYDAQQCAVVGWGGEVVLLHNVARREYRVAGIVGETSLMAQQLLDGYVEVAFVAYGVDVERVVQNALRSEHLVRQTHLAHVAQLHYAHSRDEFRHRRHAHDVRRLHRILLVDVGETESACVEQRVVARYGELSAVYLPALEVAAHDRVHGVHLGLVGDRVAERVVEVYDVC